ncbi:hypothetical protein [Methylobacter sp.]|uniref:NACHT domain-containing protein n=1 Tax=Methylobacter sp. TaxID=2051955 RepID=UPI001217C127|nr:hypothetical protein [Methylobacter sp.]TAK62912.1 MAG: hypothetical protein EPO18_09170 [Methylobacter sp.]
MSEPFISAKLIKPLYKKLTQIWETRDKEFDVISDIFGDPRTLAQYYIQPDCQQHNPTDYDEDSICSFVRSGIFKTINYFLERDTVERDGRNQMFVLADAGMGKTSLFLMLKLSQMLSFWPKDYDCLLLKLSENTLERISTQPNKAKTVLLLDALDEDPLARGRIADRLQEILEASTNFRHVLISCRTQFFPDTGLDSFGRPGRVVVGAYTCPMIFLSLFDDSQVHSYLIKRFPDTGFLVFKQADPRREQAEKLLHSMQSLQFRPLLLAHVEDLLESEQTHWNSYTIYEALVKVWLRREIRKMENQDIKSVPNERDLWAACRLVAVYLQSLGKRALPESELAQLIAKLPAVSHLKHLDFGGRSLLNRTSSKDYRFAHYSIQEFFVANAACMETLIPDWQLCPLDSSPFPLPKLTAQIISFIRCFDSSLIPRVFFSFNWQGLKLDQFIFQDKLANGNLGPDMMIIPPIDSQSDYLQMDLLEDEDRRFTQLSLKQKEQFSKPFALSKNKLTYDKIVEISSLLQFKKALTSENSKHQEFLNSPYILARYCVNQLSISTEIDYRLADDAELEYASLIGFIDDYSNEDEANWILENMLILSDPESKLKIRHGTDNMAANLRIKSKRLNMALLKELSSLDRLNAEKLLHENGPFFRVARDL